MDSLSVVHLVGHASPLVQGILLGLLVLSVSSWAFIVERYGALKAMKADQENTLRAIAGQGIAFFERVQRKKEPSLSERIACAGLQAVACQHSPILSHDWADVRRALEQASQQEAAAMERRLGFLATVAMISPYIGLLGTVWGILWVIQSMGGDPHTTLNTLAPGIAESLIATAMGLFVAIPASLAYNRYVQQVAALQLGCDQLNQLIYTTLKHHEAGRP